VILVGDNRNWKSLFIFVLKKSFLDLRSDITGHLSDQCDLLQNTQS